VQVSLSFVKVNKYSLQTNITSLNHVPTKASWDLAVTKALQMVKGRHSELVKVKHLLTFPTIPKRGHRKHNWHDGNGRSGRPFKSETLVKFTKLYFL
jgi:hypothetical protein